MPKRSSPGGQDWLLLVHQLPAKPTSLRVRIWRKLQQLGAVAVKNSIYVLPYTEKTHEDFEWLKQDIESCGGEAAVFRAKTVEGATDQEIVAQFQKTRDEEYQRVAAELIGLAGALREQKRAGHLSPARLPSIEAEVEKLHGEFEKIVATDFFAAGGRAAALSAYERCRKMLRDKQGRLPDSAITSAGKGGVDLAEYQGRRWVTRRHLHIDRLACAWLIKRFIDRRARFFFVGEDEAANGGVGFDMFGVDLTHHGDDCTFETILKRLGLGEDPGLCAMAEIVHDIDLKDGKFARKEAAGLDAVVTGLAQFLKDDTKLVQQSAVLFDGLYSVLGRSGKTVLSSVEAESRPPKTRRKGKHS